MEDISSIYGFFHRTEAEDYNESFDDCAIEVSIRDPSLPVLSNKDVEAIKIEQFENTMNPIGELIKKINDVHRGLSKEEKDQANIEVEHKFLDFSFLVLGNKIRGDGDYALDDF